MSIDTIIAGVIGKEGRYSNNPLDRGGETMWGITKSVARANNYDGDMKAMPRSVAERIYRSVYVVAPGFEKVSALSEKIAAELVDTGVNMGPDVPARWFQEWLNALNNQGVAYPDIVEDGQIGPATINAFASFLKSRGEQGESIMLRALNCSQGARYKDLARARVKNEAFVFGWLANRVGL